MPHRMRQPSALSAVAALLILGGMQAAMLSVLHFHRGSGGMDLGALNILVGIGLLRRDAYYYQWVLVSCWLALLLGAAIFTVLVAGSSQSSRVTVFELGIGSISPAYEVVLAVIFLGVTAWQIRVLQRPEVRALFAQRDRGWHSPTAP